MARNGGGNPFLDIPMCEPCCPVVVSLRRFDWTTAFKWSVSLKVYLYLFVIALMSSSETLWEGNVGVENQPLIDQLLRWGFDTRSILPSAKIKASESSQICCDDMCSISIWAESSDFVVWNLIFVVLISGSLLQEVVYPIIFWQAKRCWPTSPYQNP